MKDLLLILAHLLTTLAKLLGPGGCASRKLISLTIKPPFVHNGDVNHQPLEIPQPFQLVAATLVVIQDYPFQAINACASNDNS